MNQCSEVQPRSCVSRRSVVQGGAGAAALLGLGTRGTAAQSDDFLTEGIDLHDIPPELMPFAAVTNYPIGTGDGFDEEGVRLNLRAGEWHDNPVTQSQYGMMMLAGYRETGESEFLDVAIANGDRIYSYGEDRDGGMYFPYGFNFNLYGNSDMPLKAPWYSGMAQGQVLDFFVRLWEATGDDVWKQRADHVFGSFSEPMNKSRPWWPNIDENNNLWFEEYPFDPEQHVLNGHVFAVAGVYGYWRATSDEWAGNLTKGSIRTILDRKEDFRVVGEQSLYALVQMVQHDTYHTVHIDQLIMLHAMTQDDSFAQTADSFDNDWNLHLISGEIVVEAGEYLTPVVKQEAAQLDFEDEQVTTTFDASTSLHVNQRRREFGTDKVYYRISSGELAGTWIEETASNKMLGQYLGKGTYIGTTRGSLMPYVGVRPFQIAAGQYDAFPVDTTDFTGSPEVLEIVSDTECGVVARVRISAEPYYQLDLEVAGMWWVRASEGLAPVN